MFIGINLYRPSAIGTPFPEHGRNRTGYRAKLPQPLYAPELVAGAILNAAQHKRRSIMVGGACKLQVLGATMFPLLFDRVAQHVSGTLIDYETPADDVDGNLYAPQGNDGRIEGRQRGRRFSAFTAARLHPVAALGTLAALGAVGPWAATRDTAGLAKA